MEGQQTKSELEYDFNSYIKIFLFCVKDFTETSCYAKLRGILLQKMVCVLSYNFLIISFFKRKISRHLKISKSAGFF